MIQKVDNLSFSIWIDKSINLNNFNINSRNNSTSKYKQFLTLNVRFISLKWQEKRIPPLMEGFLGAI